MDYSESNSLLALAFANQTLIKFLADNICMDYSESNSLLALAFANQMLIKR
ncbi:MAG: hypothetical protein HAW61_01115 [Candidatus Portiera sp.]|nr:hypothetical protein [Portiera sp.]